MFEKFWQSYGPWHLKFLHILACLLNSSYILAWIWMKLGRESMHHKSRSACGEIIHVRQILAELWSLTLRIFTDFSLINNVFSTPPTSLYGFEWKLAGILHHKSRSACGEIIHVRQILAELWSLTLRFFYTFWLVFSTPPKSLYGFEWKLAVMLHHKSRSTCGEIIHVWQILAELWSLTLRFFTHFGLVFSTPPTSFYGFEWKLAGMLHHKSRSACGEIIHVRQNLAELWSLTLRIFTDFSLIVFSTPPTSLHGFEWNLAGVLRHKSRWTCGMLFYVLQILQ